MGIKLAIIGACGMVGRKVLELLCGEYTIDGLEIICFEQPSKHGRRMRIGGRSYKLVGLTEDRLRETRPDYAIFVAGGTVSAKFAQIIREWGGVAIDNSSHFRMDVDVPLVIPHVNADTALVNHGIIANPNCSTIQAVIALAPLHREFGLRRVVFSTYQAASGAGKYGMDDLQRGNRGGDNEFFTHQLSNNLIPHIDVFMSDGYTKEEQKLMTETKKILGLPNLAVTATAVRVPITNCHSISINAEFEKPFTLDRVRQILTESQEQGGGVILYDNPSNFLYPMPRVADNRDEVFVGRLRMDPSHPNTLDMFCTADNVRRGAATNAIQILKFLIARGGV